MGQPDIIHKIDSRIKQQLFDAYVQDKAQRAQNFKSFFARCAPEARSDLNKYWQSIPLRKIKKAAKKDDDFQQYLHELRNINNQHDSTEKITPKKQTTDKKHKEHKEGGSKHLTDSDRNMFRKMLGKCPSMKTVNDVFNKYFYIYQPNEFADFLMSSRKQEVKKEKSPNKPGKTVKKKKTKQVKIEGLFRNPLLTTIDTIPWNAVEFKNGCVYLYNYKKYKAHDDIIKKNEAPYIFQCKESRECFNQIKPYFANKLSPIIVVLSDGKIVGVESKINLENAIRILRYNSEDESWSVDDSQFVVPANFRTAAGISQTKVLETIKRKKSAYLNALVESQLKAKKIVPSIELLLHQNSESEEDAFIFTLGHYRNDMMRIVYENVNEARSTVVFVVRIEDYTKALMCIFNFMRSREVNKRRGLHYMKYDFKKSGVMTYNTANHTTVSEWKSLIRI